MMAVATVDDVGKCCEADTAVSYISLVVDCKLTQSNYHCLIDYVDRGLLTLEPPLSQ